MKFMFSKLTLLVVTLTLAMPATAAWFVRFPSIQGEATDYAVQRVQWLTSSREPIPGQPGRVAVVLADPVAGNAAQYTGKPAQLVGRHRVKTSDGSAAYMIIELQNAQITSFQLGRLDNDARVVLSYQNLIERPAR